MAEYPRTSGSVYIGVMMNKLKMVVFHLPILLLISYIGLCFYRAPILSDSVIIVALAGLYGFLMYIRLNDPVAKKTDPNIIRLEKEIEVIRLEREKFLLESDIGRIVASKGGESEKTEKFRF